MDPNANTGPVGPDPGQPHPHDIAQPGPIDPATGQPARGAEVSELKAWFRQNATSLLVTAAVIAAVCVWLDPFGALLVVLGLGLVIFIHELGHFAAAKWCDVHVKTFSIGFGPAVPFCSYRWGETTYMVGIIPLGGYVQMGGEGETAEGDEEGEEDPRSFKKKSVGQRMVIISAGVIMNVILGMACFVAAYLHGVQEIPATVGRVESGGAAWRAGIKSDDEVVRIAGLDNPSFKDIPPAVMTTHEGEAVPIQVKRDGTALPPMAVEPQRDEGQLFPQLGIGSPQHLVLPSFGKGKVKPVIPGTPAAEAKAAGGQGFEPGDRVVAMSDPAGGLTPVKDFAEYHRRMVRLGGQPVTFELLRKGEADEGKKVAVTVPPAYRHSLGMRMRMGQVVAVREGGPNAGKILPRSEKPARAGDRIKAVLLPPDADGDRVWYVNGSVFSEEKGKKDELKPEFQLPGLDAAAVRAKVKIEPLDPLLLPQQINRWADRQAAGNRPPELDLVVLREENHTEVSRRIPMDYDPTYRYAREFPSLPNSPLPLSGLGVAYWVEAVVDDVAPGGPAAEAVTAPGEAPGGFWNRVKRLFGAAEPAADAGGPPKPPPRGTP